MDILDLVKEFIAMTKGTFPGHQYALGAQDFAKWVKEQKYDDRFCSCYEDYNIYLDNTDGLTKCSGCEKPIWAV